MVTAVVKSPLIDACSGNSCYGPDNAAVSNALGLAYTTKYGAPEGHRTIAVIDMATAKVTGVVGDPLGIARIGDITGVVASADGHRVYYVSGNQFGVIDAMTSTFVAAMDLPDGAAVLAVSPDDSTAYVAGGGTVYIVSLSSMTVSATVSLDPGFLAATGPGAIRVNGDGSKVYVLVADPVVSLPGGGWIQQQDVAVVDTTTLTVHRVSDPQGLILDNRPGTWPTGYVNGLAAANGKVYLSQTEGDIRGSCEGGPPPERVARGTVVVIDDSTDSALGAIVLPGPTGDAIGADLEGREIYVDYVKCPAGQFNYSRMGIIDTTDDLFSGFVDDPAGTSFYGARAAVDPYVPYENSLSCVSAKRKAAATALKKTVACHFKAMKMQTAVDAGCVAAANAKLVTVFQQAGGSCPGEAAETQSLVDACLTATLADLPPSGVCAVNSLRAAGKAAFKRSICLMKEATRPGSFAKCAAKVGAQLSLELAKQGSCAAADLPLHVSACTADVMNALSR